MDKKIVLAIILMVAVVMGGIAYANVPQTGSQQNTAISGNATNVAFQNNATSWKHVVAAFDITKTNGNKKKVYADLWIKPKGTANVDLSHALGYGNQALPKGTKIKMNTYKDPNVPTSQLPNGIADNKVTTTTDPTQGGQFLASITSISSSKRIITSSTSIIIQVKIIIIKVIISGPLCVNTGGSIITLPSNGNSHIIRGSWLHLLI
jgi:hypothetical protein